MNNTIQPVQKPVNWKRRKQLVDWSGYIALGAGTICGATGFKSVKIPQKRNIHKYSAYLAGVTSFLHLGFVKGWDRIFTKNDN